MGELTRPPLDVAIPQRFTAPSGILYLAVGGLLLLWPGAIQSLLLDSYRVGREAERVRRLAMTVAIIGWSYHLGGRSGFVLTKPASLPTILRRRPKLKLWSG